MNGVECQDEILQMMYWMRGEQLGERVNPEQLNRFLNVEGSTLTEALHALMLRGLVVQSDDCYSLTERGLVEAGRRFLDEFSAVLGKDDHLSCSNPDCDCQSPGFDGICHSVSVKHSPEG